MTNSATQSVEQDYYAILGIHENADDAELRRVWRGLARRWHPDHAGASATASFQKLAAAYAVLSDPVSRAAYDTRRAASRPGSAGGTARASAPNRRRAPSVMLSRVSGPLNALLACGVARWVNRNVLELILRAAEAMQGGMVAISMRVPVTCRKCAGRGAGCAPCNGRGTTEELFSAWLAVPPDTVDGAVLLPSELLPGMVHPVRFQIRISRR
jgi:DnaJ-class molecular chaperone